MPEDHLNRISFYIVAHADDWQLFMQPNAYNDLVAAGSKVVCIITTAGDAGAGETYWRSREEGLKSSLRFCLAPREDLSENIGTRVFGNHTINYWSANNVTSYFLRLPDGGLNGNGFSAYHHQSLPELKKGSISSIFSLDDSTTYQDWPDFYTTIETIIRTESKDISDIRINYLNPDTNENLNDHPDHIATGQAIRSMDIICNVTQVLYVGYSVNNVWENLPLTQLFWKSAIFAAYEKAVYDEGDYSTLRESVVTYLRWSLSGADFIIINPRIL